MIYILRSIFLPKNVKTMEWKMLRLLNKDRRKYKLKPLFMQEDLRRVARSHSKDMAKLDYFEHENWMGQTHVDRLKEAKVTDVNSGENLAKIGGYKFPVTRAEIGLMNSPGHRANILNKTYNCVGIGLHISEKKVYYFTQNFAKRSLIFLRKPRKSINTNKSLILKFKPVNNSTRMGIYRISDASGIILEKGFPIIRGKNVLNIQINEIGLYKIELFTEEKPQNELRMTNSFNIRVTRARFWLF